MKNIKIKNKKPSVRSIQKEQKDPIKVQKPIFTLKNIGKIGENTACHYLKTKGHTILGQNIRLGRGEIDILSKKDGTLHLIEVKTNKIGANIQAEQNITPIKKKRLINLANRVLSQYASNSSLFANLESDQKADRGMILRDNPPIQIDVVVVRLRFLNNSLKNAFVKYYPSII